MKKAGSVIVRILSVILCAFLFAVAFFNIYNLTALRRNDAKASFLGIKLLPYIKSDMRPTVQPNDAVAVKKSDVYFPGDIVLYLSDDKKSLNVGRLYGAFEDENGNFLYSVHFDSLYNKEAAFPAENAVGRVCAVIKNSGDLVYFLSTPFGIFLTLFFATGMIIIPILFEDLKKYKAAESIENQEEKAENIPVDEIIPPENPEEVKEKYE